MTEFLELGTLTIALLLLAAFVAGWVDAVVGGGGLIQLPALLIGLPDSHAAGGHPRHQQGQLGVGDRDQLDHLRRTRPARLADHRPAGGGVRGRLRAGRPAGPLPAREWFTPIVLVALVGVGIYTWRRPELGLVSARKHDGRAHYGRTAAIGLGVGAYDGFLGPGTGSFFVILLVGVLGYGFLEASAKAKIANLVTNLAAIAVFAASGSILWVLGLVMGAANLVGGLLGARTAISRGNAFIRRVFLVVLAGLVLRLSYDLVRQLVG